MAARITELKKKKMLHIIDKMQKKLDRLEAGGIETRALPKTAFKTMTLIEEIKVPALEALKRESKKEQQVQ